MNIEDIAKGLKIYEQQTACTRAAEVKDSPHILRRLGDLCWTRILNARAIREANKRA